MHRAILIVVILVAASSITAAQRAELSGTWVLESKKHSETTLAINESGPEIRITETEQQNGKPVTRELIYFGDGRGETNSSRDGKLQLHSTSRRSDRKLIVKFSLPQTRADNLSITNERVDEWTISKDGKTLKHTTSMRTSPKPGDVSSHPSGIQTPLSFPLNWDETRVFKRVP